MKKIQVSIDDETARLLQALAAARAGNTSFVVRVAVHRMAQQEGFEHHLDWLERQPEVRASLEQALADERENRTVAHERVVRRFWKPRCV
jgi:predicted transcriptional regulator